MTMEIKTSKKYNRLRILLIAFRIAFRNGVCPYKKRLRYYTSHIMRVKDFRTHLKNVFWPNIFVGASFQILDIQQYASGLKVRPAAILNQNPIFEMDSG